MEGIQLFLAFAFGLIVCVCIAVTADAARAIRKQINEVNLRLDLILGELRKNR